MELAKRLSTLRKQSKSSLRAVSKRCNCSFQQLQKLEKGLSSRPKIELLLRLAVFYQFPPDTLIVEAGKIPPDIYWKIVQNPDLIPMIRSYKAAA